MTKVKLLTLALLAAPLTLHAQTIGVHVGSHHFSGKWCDSNPGVYYRHGNGVTVGAYRNSECDRWSAYAGYTWGDRVALTVGGVTGYRRAAVVPMVVPSVRFGPVRLAAIPAVAGSPALIHLMLERRFDIR